MDKKTTVDEELVTDEIQNWYAYQGPFGEVVCNDRSFFAWKDGCGAYGQPSIRRSSPTTCRS